MSYRIYNHQKDLQDECHVDSFKEEHYTIASINLPKSFDLRQLGFVPSILDQGTLGSCGPCEISNAIRFCLKKEKTIDFQPSRLFIYYFTRLLEESDVTQDTGISIKGALVTIQKYGACSEINLPYDITKFAIKPSVSEMTSALQHIPGFKYKSIPQSLISIKQALFSGFPIVLGIQVYTSFESDIVANTGNVPIPNLQSENLLGGHSISIYSFNDTTQLFTCSNSWGNNWGQDGYFTIPYAYLLNPNLASDFWQISYFK